MFPKTHYVRGYTLKIYSVTFTGWKGQRTRVLWTNYQSAAQSYGYWKRRAGDDVVFEAVHVSDDAWRPVDKVTESRLNRVAILWDQLVRADQDGLDALLDELVKRVQPAKMQALQRTEGLLLDEAKREAEALLDRLVDAS